ncbi:hypothetical protein [Amycolatopsis sp. CA-230715]|uniref:hypothetical protein n=1 Tax=Amycolatopsis sp. CA-230715 TaxID=2745196 RepID=UPI001C00A62A|nr:hypothetical protein [Amycolatopsis sp. CA-230715]QWF76758.1 hypothetical protein HUW46_00134 [Amycolatopsis sp. CA-230715]
MSDKPEERPDEPTRPLEEPVPATPADSAEPTAPAAPAEPPAAEAPATASAAAVPPQAPPPPAPAATAPPGGFGRFVRHRATQLVTVGVIGLLIGGGGIALIESGSSPHDRGGHHAFDHQRGGRGPDRHGGERGQHPQQPGTGA